MVAWWRATWWSLFAVVLVYRVCGLSVHGRDRDVVRAHPMFCRSVRIQRRRCRLLVCTEMPQRCSSTNSEQLESLSKRF